jgi:hypothetical protein
MRNDQIFVLLLVIILPMSGCFDGAVGDAEADDDSNETTVINNYYYNNTTIVESDSNVPEYFVVGGVIDNNTTMVEVPNQPTQYYPYNFSTTSGQTLYIHQLVTANSISMTSDCGEGGTWITYATQTNYQEHHNGYWVAGSAFDCEHSVKVNGPYYFSMIYSIEDMTVIPV